MKRLLALALALAFALAACGAPAPSIAAATSGTYPPFSAWTGERPDGFVPALLDAFARDRGIRVGWSRFRWNELDGDLQAGRFDVAADGMTVRPERSILGRFTVPIARGGAVLLVRHEAAGKHPLRVVVNRGGHLERVARELLRDDEIRAIPDNAEVRAAFARGEADAALTNTFEAPRWIAGLSNVDRVGPLTNDFTALWIRADRAEIADELDAWLLAAEASGRLGALRARFLGDAAGGPTATPVEALVAATAERLALMPFVAAAKRKAGRAIEDTGQEARVVAAAEAAVSEAARESRSAPPPRAAIHAFVRAQIEAAKAVQRSDTTREAAALSLERDLRPAIARITKKMAFLLVRVPPGIARDDVLREARAGLVGTGLDAEHVARIAEAIAALGAR